jgi:N-methylhydantoinase A
MGSRPDDLAATWSIGVDIGGTFTDLVAVEARTGERVSGKVLTTPANPLTGVLDALDLLKRVRDIDISKSDYLVHATTLVTNTLIERKGAKTAMLTTRGFRDIIETAHEDRYDLYDLQLEVQPSLIRRRHRIAVDERINARGEVVTPLDEEALRSALADLHGIEALAVCFLHSYANPIHERQASSLARSMLPDCYVTTSSEVAPIIREYERFIAAAINAYVAPQASKYLSSLESELRARRFGGTIGIMKSDGGMCSLAEASRLPVRILESGPAAGILSAANTAVECGEELGVALDMGGTTAKICLIANGRPVTTDELEVARLNRFASGSGLPLRIPSLDLMEIGAGGGSIAWIDGLGIMQVGPESAGADPGPACYGRGGTRPTVTDAGLLLGYLDPEYFAGGAFSLDPTAAEKAIRDDILKHTGTDDPILAAWGIYDIVNENMARAARLHCLEHGIDPTSVTLIATGGGAPLHAAALLTKLGARRVVCPPDAGVASALGLLLAPRTRDLSVTEVMPLDELTHEDLGRRLAQLDAQLADDADEEAAGQIVHFLDVRLRGQAYEIRVRVPDDGRIDSLRGLFDVEYEARFGRAPWPAPREVVRWTVQSTHERDLLVGAPPAVRAGRSAGPRRAYFGLRSEWMDARVLDRSALVGDEPVLGPLVVPEEGTTVVVGPGQLAYVDAHSNIVIEPVAEAQSRQAHSSRRLQTGAAHR